MRGFSLIELAVVLVLAGLLAAGALTMSSATNRSGCYTTTKAQMSEVKDALNRFVIKNDRYPMPAKRTAGVSDPDYGREAPLAALDSSGGVTYGALPFQALGLPTSFAADCWDNKFTYAVTTGYADASGGFLNIAVDGAITIKSNLGNILLDKGTYAVISHGEDGLGAVKRNYHGAAANWCTHTPLSTDIKTDNCNVTDAMLVSGEFNDGKDGADKYFDDIIIFLGRLQAANPAPIPTNVYCWGYNGAGPVGNNTLTTQLTPVQVLMPTAETFTQISTGDNSCGLAASGKTFCWGSHASYQIGDGLANAAVPRMMPTEVIGGHTFSSISVGNGHVCAIASAPTTYKAYCWGNNNNGQLGDGFDYTKMTPPNMAIPVAVLGGHNYQAISAGSAHSCGLDLAGKAWCWGNNDYGQIGDNTYNPSGPPFATPYDMLAPTAAIMPVPAFRSISSGAFHTCALTSMGTAYCWGANANGQLGDGTITDRHIPTSVAQGPLQFSQINASALHTCALTFTGEAYCWGHNMKGQIGDGSQDAGIASAPVHYNPVLVPVAPGILFAVLTTGIEQTCGITTFGTEYCWGHEDQLGNGVAGTPALTPSAVLMPAMTTFSGLGGQGKLGSHSCALVGTPPPLPPPPSPGCVDTCANTRPEGDYWCNNWDGPLMHLEKCISGAIVNMGNSPGCPWGPAIAACP